MFAGPLAQTKFSSAAPCGTAHTCSESCLAWLLVLVTPTGALTFAPPPIAGATGSIARQNPAAAHRAVATTAKRRESPMRCAKVAGVKVRPSGAARGLTVAPCDRHVARGEMTVGGADRQSARAD